MRLLLNRRHCLLAATPCPAWAQDGELRVIGDAFARIYASDAQGAPRGYGRELVERVARRLGLRARFQLGAWTRAQALLESGQADLLIAPYYSAARERRYAFSRAPIYVDRMRLFTRQTRRQGWNGRYDALARTEIGVLRGWIYGEAFERARPNLRLLTENSPREALLSLLRERFDLLAANEADIIEAAAALRVSDALRPLDPPLGEQAAHLGFAHGATGTRLRQAFDAELESLRRNGEMAALARRWEVRLG